MALQTKALIALVASLAISPATSWASAQYSWKFNNGNCIGASDDSGNFYAKGSALPSSGHACGTQEANKIHSLTFGGSLQSGTTDLPTPPKVVASGWASDNQKDNNGNLIGAAVLTKDDLVRWSGGLGIENRFEVEATNGPHALSNDGHVYELIMFEFDVPIALDLVSAGYAPNVDGDISVLRFAGGVGSTPDPMGVPYKLDGEGLTGTDDGDSGTGWELIANWDLTTSTPADLAALPGDIAASNHWVVAAHIKAFGDTCINDPSTSPPQQCVNWNDTVKIDLLKGTYHPPSDEPGDPIPVPPTLWLSLAGLAWITKQTSRDRKSN